MKRVVFISQLGEPSVYNTDDFTSMCPSGLEKDWIKERLQPVANRYNFQLESVDVCRGDELPDVHSVDAVIISGSRHTPTDSYPWLDTLKSWLLDYRKRARPLLGVCAGHQLVSTLFDDAKLSDRDDGLMAGAYTIDLNERGQAHPLFAGLSAKPTFLFANYMHITLPAAAQDKVLASVSGSPAIVVDHGDHWFSSQFHPESCAQTWRCYYKHAPDVNTDAYAGSHDGAKMMENFFAIAQAATAS
ncbi:glutamine amidotransferase-related protein [Marinobacter sp. X15-166B]|uniref:glutamine amidotransferase-related protein n=1 Tax=Marinobacter sp. X15-166B TaxID=1897620 RepID=UPI00085C6528|nr:hypothetical protein [Marinobacter sp. X15-166B]OEY65391.1 hypothetical protein BG841_02245 [Marinobacter sp. X15-166B]